MSPYVYLYPFTNANEPFTWVCSDGAHCASGRTAEQAWAYYWDWEDRAFK